MPTAEQQTKAVNWFIGKAKTAAGFKKKLFSNEERQRSRGVIGKMYFFSYDPKHKLTLPMYDRFPLVFPIERYSDGFLGLNLHYMAHGERAVLLNRLSSFRNNNAYNERTKLNLSYALLASTKKLDMARPLIKRYLFGHVRSKFIEITADEWDMAIALPVDQWVYNNRKFQ